MSKAHVKALTCMIRTLSALWISESFASFFLSEATLLSKCSLWRAYSLWISASTPAESSWKKYDNKVRHRNHAKHLNTPQFLLLGTGKKIWAMADRRVRTPETIDLFTYTAAILNYLDLRSIMGCPGGTRSVFTRAFWAKRERHCIFLGKKAIIITSKHGTTILFFSITIFS